MWRKHPDLTACLVLTFLVLCTVLPFLNHAFHIDEPLFLRIAEQIKQDPLNPYGFLYLWHINIQPVSQIAAFPPLFCYVLALVGWNYTYPPEWLIHLSLIPFALLGVLAFYVLARQFSFSPLWSFLAAALLGLSPAFVISANMAMPDVANLSLTLLAVTLCIRGWLKGRLSLLIWGGISLGLATLMRYNSVPILLILFFLGLTFTDSKKALLPGAIGGLFLLFWMAWSRLTSGEAHVSETFNTFANSQELIRHFWALNNHLSLTTLLPFLALFLIGKRRFFWFTLIAFISADFSLYAGKSGQINHFHFWPDIFFFGLGILMFTTLLVIFLKTCKKLKFWNLTRERDERVRKFVIGVQEISPEQKEDFRNLILFLWIGAVLVLPLIYVMFASKYLLMALPPLILILLKELQAQNKGYLKFAFLLLPILLILSLSVAFADFSFANIYRENAENLSKEKRSPYSRLWFTGHWGWQYYIEKFGGIPLPYQYQDQAGPSRGDMIIMSQSTSPQPVSSSLQEDLRLVDQTEYNLSFPLRTMNHNARAGLYSDYWGPLPYAFSVQPVEVFRVYLVRR